MGTKPSKLGVYETKLNFGVLGNVPIYLVSSPGLLGSVPILGDYLVLYIFLLGLIPGSDNDGLNQETGMGFRPNGKQIH